MTASLSSNNLGLFAAKFEKLCLVGNQAGGEVSGLQNQGWVCEWEYWCERSMDSGAAGNGSGRYGSEEETRVGVLVLDHATEKTPTRRGPNTRQTDH